MSTDESLTEQGERVSSLRELREYATGRLDVPHSDVHRVAGLIDDEEARQAFLFHAENYDRNIYPDEIAKQLPRRYEDTEHARRFIQKHATDAATEAIKEGNVSQVAYLTGLPSYKPDVSGLHAITQLEDWLVNSEQCKLIYLAALMGRGKTDLSLTFFEVIGHHYDRLRDAGEDVPEVEFAANFHAETGESSGYEVKSINRYDELLEWAERGNSDMERWFIFDEASTELTAQSGANAQKVAERMAPFVKKMRKLGVNMIVIGHDKGDVHVAIRSLADFVDKTGLKTASFYAGIKKREPTGHLFDLAGIPETSWSYSTDDMAEWDWCEDADGVEDAADRDPLATDEFRDWRDERIARVYAQTQISQSDLGNALGVSQKTVSRAVNNVEVDTTEAKAVAD